MLNRKGSTEMRRQTTSKSSKSFVGMDVHNESIDWAIAKLDGELRSVGRTGGDRTTVGFAQDGDHLSFGKADFLHQLLASSREPLSQVTIGPKNPGRSSPPDRLVRPLAVSSCEHKRIQRGRHVPQ